MVLSTPGEPPMTVQTTEEASERYRDIDAWSSTDIASAIAAAQREAVDAVAAVVPDLARAGDAIAERMLRGGRLVYAGAGSSGLLAQVDALELPGTYGIPASSVPVLLAGGREALFEIPSGAEDDGQEAMDAVDALAIGGDDVLLAISASGRTPYALAALRRGKAAGALTIGLASNPGTPLLVEAHHPILLATPPEVIAGSTRMNAGTAQKCALNMLSTLVGIRLGHVYQGMMVNLRADNAKLRGRAVGMVARACRMPEVEARVALDAVRGDIKAAIVLAAGAGSADHARALLAQTGGRVRDSLAALPDRQ